MTDTRIRISGIRIPCPIPADEERSRIRSRIAAKLHMDPAGIREITIEKRSLDARKKPDLFYLYTVDITPADPRAFAKKSQAAEKAGWKFGPVPDETYHFPESGQKRLTNRPVIVGAGPAGYFCAMMLAEHGYRPLVLERGRCVSERTRDVDARWKDGTLDPDSNVQFGEGGAGTFSDGKLNTMTKDREHRGRKVFETFVRHGAPEEILYVNKPHVGTDVLKHVVAGFRGEIESNGGEVRFGARVTDVEVTDGHVTAVTVNGSERIPCGVLVLALGHSARDTFRMLEARGLAMTAKAFAVGFRIQHPQVMIDESQYGRSGGGLPAADYKVTWQTESGRGVYSFCMCPGGYVVDASSEPGRIAVNGMSYHARDGVNANSALIVTVTPEDFGGSISENGTADPLAGLEFQRKLEEAAYREGNGSIPVQLYGDYRENRVSTGFGDVKPAIEGRYTFGNLRQVLPAVLNDAILEAMPQFGRKIRGFDREDAILAGVESRTSSPVRMERGEDGTANIKGIYPCGEGAGYAGGITSACMDGMRMAEAIAAAYSPLCDGE